MFRRKTERLTFPYVMPQAKFSAQCGKVPFRQQWLPLLTALLLPWLPNPMLFGPMSPFAGMVERVTLLQSRKKLLAPQLQQEPNGSFLWATC